jgi:hypothetical protein
MNTQTENTIEIGSTILVDDIIVHKDGSAERWGNPGGWLIPDTNITTVIRNGAILKVVPKKEPLVWTGQAQVVNELNPRTYVNLPGYWSGKTVEVREITEPKPAPELDLSPLTEEEFRRLEIGDVVCLKLTDHEKRVNEVGVNELGEFQFIHLFEWAFREGPWIPSEATARRLGRGVTA